jgi:hypothetical protein
MLFRQREHNTFLIGSLWIKMMFLCPVWLEHSDEAHFVPVIDWQKWESLIMPSDGRETVMPNPDPTSEDVISAAIVTH